MIVYDYFDHPDPGAINWSSYVFYNITPTDTYDTMLHFTIWSK